MADGFKQIIGGLLVTVLGFYGVLHAEWINVTNPNNPCGHNITQATYYQIIDDYCYAVFESSTTWTPPVETIEYALIGGGGGSKGGWEACPMGGTSQLIDGTTLCTWEITDTTQPTTFTPYNFGITTFNYLLIGGGGGTGGGTGSNQYPNPLNADNGGSVSGNESAIPSNITYTVRVGGGGTAGSHTWEMPQGSISANPGDGGANDGIPGQRVNFPTTRDNGPGGSGGGGGNTRITYNATILNTATGSMGSLGGANQNEPPSAPSYTVGALYDFYQPKYGTGGQYFGDRDGKNGVAVIRYNVLTTSNRNAGPAGFIKGKFTAGLNQKLTIVIGNGGNKGTWDAAGAGGTSIYSSTSYGGGGAGGKSAGFPGGGGGGGASVILMGSTVTLVAPGGAGGGAGSTIPSAPILSDSTAPRDFPGTAGNAGAAGGGGGGGGGGGTGGNGVATVATAGKYYVDATFSSDTITLNAINLPSFPTLRPQSLGDKKYGQIQTDSDGVNGVAIFKYPAQYNYTDIALATSNTYPIVKTVTLTSNLVSNNIITIAVVGGSDPSDELTIPTRNTPSYNVVNALGQALNEPNEYYQVNQYMSGWGGSTATPEPMNLRGVMRLKIKADTINSEYLNTILQSIRLKTNGYRRHKIIAFLKGPNWTCYNARTISDNYRIECSQYRDSMPNPTADSEHGLTWRKKVIVSPNEGAAFRNFENVCNGYKASASATDTYETDQASTISNWVPAGQVLTSGTATNSPGSCAAELTTAGLEQLDSNTIHYRLHILRPNPILHAIPF